MIEGQTPPPLMPLPVPEAAPRSKRGVWIALSAVVVVLLACAIAAAVSLSWVFSQDGLDWLERTAGYSDSLGDEDYGYQDPGGARAALWTADGRFAVAQAYTEDGMPCVIAIDPSGGEPDVVENYILAAVEPTGSVVWLRDGSHPWGSDPGPDAAPLPALTDGMFDSPGEYSLVRWDLGGAYPEPVQARYPVWAPLANGSGITAQFTVDETAGTNPTGITFKRDGSPAVDARIHPDIVTFHVIGWSPSGKYFAIEQLVQVSEYGPSEYYSEDVYDGPLRYLVILDAETGKAVFEKPAMNDGMRPAFWHSKRDVVMWANQRVYEDAQTGTESEPARLMAASPDGTSARASQVLGFEEPVAWKDLYQLTLIGCEPAGMLVTAPWAGTPLWLIDPSGAVVGAGSADDVDGGAWNERYGLLSMGQYTDPDTSAELDALRLYDVHGGPRRDLWLATPPVSDEGAS